MTFRRDGRLEHRWKQWVEEHQAFLTEQCGLPLGVTRDRVEWFHFLDHGYSRSEPFSPLTDAQCEMLVLFLSQQVGEEFGPVSAIHLRNFECFLGGH